MDTSPNGDEERHLFLRHLERYPLHTRYPKIAKKVAERMADPELITAIRYPWDPSEYVEYIYPELVIDVTGVGTPVTNLFKKHGLKFRKVTVTGEGGSGIADGSYQVSKKDLIASLEVPFHTDRLHVAEGLQLWEDLRKELLNYRRKISLKKKGSDPLEYWREGAHDDLLLATALASWWAERGGSRWYRTIPKPVGMWFS
jgi:hypothetical protein